MGVGGSSPFVFLGEKVWILLCNLWRDLYETLCSEWLLYVDVHYILMISKIYEKMHFWEKSADFEKMNFILQQF